MMTTDKIIELLRDAIDDPRRLGATIDQIQRLIWADDVEATERDKQILADLAVDLDYFEPDPSARSEDRSFFGEERALAEIRAALGHLRTS